MPKQKGVRKIGWVIETLPNTQFRVRTEQGNEIIAHLSGRLRLYRIKVLAGDEVTVEMSPYDDSKGRIVWRGKKR